MGGSDDNDELGGALARAVVKEIMGESTAMPFAGFANGSSRAALTSPGLVSGDSQKSSSYSSNSSSMSDMLVYPVRYSYP